jgi:ATP-dependent DNA helicase RecG
MAKRSFLPLFHPNSAQPEPLALTLQEFSEAFPEESRYVEFKTGISSKAVQRTVTAFSNTDGGVLLIGVDDQGRVQGRSLTSGVESDITRAILAVSDPGRYWLHELLVDDLPVTIVSVARRSQGFAQTPDGQIVVRRGSESAPLMGAELLHFLTDRALHRFDTSDTDVLYSEVSQAHLETVRQVYRWRSAGDALTDHLKNEGLLSQDRQHLTVAGALTLLTDPRDALGKPFVEILRYPDEGIDYEKRMEVGGPVQQQVANATALLMAELGTDLVISGVRRVELPKLPEVVIREAIANAVAHRSYEENGRSIRVEVRPDRVVVLSPGGLPEPVTEENIRDSQFARNIRVINVLRRFRLAEDSGRGVDVMIDRMAEALLDPPRFRDLGHSVEVTLPVRGAISPQERAWLQEVERMGVIEPRDRVLLVHAARGEELTNERVRELLNVDSRDARASLQRLRDAGFLEQMGERGGSRYVMALSVGAPAAFRMSPAALRKVAVDLAKQGPITNAAIRAATGLDRPDALRLLDALVREGLLIRRGERRGAHYVSPTRADQ